MNQPNGPALHFFAILNAVIVLILAMTQGVTQAQSTAGSQSLSEVVVANGVWDKNTNLDQQLQAYEIFLRANELVKEGSPSEAVRRYEDALKIWQHPAIYYNLSVAQGTLGQRLAIYHSLLRAIEYGPAPLGQSKYEQAKNRLEVLRGQLSQIELVCDDEGAEVTLDGRQLFIGPGTRTEVVIPGEHQVVADRIDRFPDTQKLYLQGGQKKRIVLKLRTSDDTQKYRRWRWWVPVAVAGTSTVFLASGNLLQNNASSQFDIYDERFTVLCRDGCPDADVDPKVTAIRNSATHRQNMSRASYAIGGVILATSLLLAYLNKEKIRRTKHRDSDELPLGLQVSRRTASISTLFSF